MLLGELVGKIRADDDELTSGLKTAERKFDKFGDSVSSSFDKVGPKLKESGKVIGTGAAVATGAALSVGLASALNTEAAQAKLKAQLGGTGPMAEELGGIAGRLYANAYGENLGEVNDAVMSVINSGALMEDATNEQIESMTAQAMSLSQAFGVDVNESMRAVGQMMRTGLAPDAQTAMDILVRGFQQGIDKSGDLLDTFNEYGTHFRKVGIDGQTAMGLISQAVKAGARDTDVAADAIKEFAIRAIDGSKLTGEGFKALGLDAKHMADEIAAGGPRAAAAFDMTLDKLREMKDPVAQSAAAVALFGTQAEDLGAALFAMDATTAVKQLGDVAGAAERMDKVIGDTAQAKITGMTRQFEQWAASIVAVDGPLGTVAAAGMAFGEQGLGIAANVGVLAIAMRGLGLSAFFTAGGFSAAWAALTGPIGLAVAAVAIAVALIWYHWDTLKEIPGKVIDWFTSLPDGLGGVATDAWNAVEGALSRGWDKTKAWVADIPYNMGYMLGALIGILLRVGTDSWDSLNRAFWRGWDQTVAFATSAPGKIGDFLSNLPGVLWDAASRGWRGFIDSSHESYFGFLRWVDSIPGGILSALGDLGRLLWNAGKSIIDGLLAGIKAGYHAMISYVSGIGAGIAANKGPLDYDRRLLIPQGNAIMEGLLGGLKRGNSFVQDFVSGIVGEMQAKLSNNNFQFAGGAGGLSPQHQSLLDTAKGALTQAGMKIENFNAYQATDERRLAEELDWISRGKGK